MRTGISCLGVATLFVAACGGAEEQAPDRLVSAQSESESVASDAIGTTEQFVVWLPNTDPMNVEHLKWHTGHTNPSTYPNDPVLPCGSAGVRTAPPGSGCPGSTSGKEFLRFHRDFLHRLYVKHEQALRPLSERTPWTDIGDDSKVFALLPPDVKNSYAALARNVDPNTGQPFADENTFGLYLEQFVHNALHGIVQQAYPTDVDTSGKSVGGAILPINTSPTSTYFFKIHGLVETLYERWQRSKLQDGMYSNLIFRNVDTGADSVAAVTYNSSTNKASITSTTTLESVPIPNSCNWYIAGVADFDFDGNNDIVWHGPGCTSGANIKFWKMNGTTHVSDLPSINNVDNTWQLVGTQDFNQDLKPDLIWMNKNNQNMDVWFMNGTTFSGFYDRYTVPSNFKAQAILDSTSGQPNVLARNASGQTAILVPGGNGVFVTWFTLSSPAVDIYTGAGAVGHFHTANLVGDPVNQMDIAWFHLVDSSVTLWTVDVLPATYTDRGTVSGVPGGRNWLAGVR